VHNTYIILHTCGQTGYAWLRHWEHHDPAPAQLRRAMWLVGTAGSRTTAHTRIRDGEDYAAVGPRADGCHEFRPERWLDGSGEFMPVETARKGRVTSTQALGRAPPLRSFTAGGLTE
jgi:hypothetical protein